MSVNLLVKLAQRTDNNDPLKDATWYGFSGCRATLVQQAIDLANSKAVQ
jgi:hypothetical protein